MLASREDLSDTLFQHLTELAVESWFKGAQRWHITNGLPVRFASALSLERRPSHLHKRTTMAKASLELSLKNTKLALSKVSASASEPVG